MSHAYVDSFVKAIEVVTPAQAGVQNNLFSWIPAFAGMTQKSILRPVPTSSALLTHQI
jgi:hypothetical protein